MNPRRWASLLAALLAAVTVTVVVTVTTGPDGNPHGTVTVTLGGPGHKQVTLTPKAQAIATAQAKQAAAGDVGDAHADLHAEPVAASSPATLEADAALKPAGQPVIPKTIPAAAQSTPGCRTLLVRNYSSRAGAPTLLGVLHFTVSPDNGWNGVLANVRWFDNAAAQASSNYILDRRIGACALTVPEAEKAWAQAGYNRVSLSMEITANGSEGSYLPPGPGRQKVLYIMHRWHRDWKLPYSHGKVDNATCTVTHPGFVQHGDLGSCGGGHHDIAPFGDKAVDALIAEAKATDPTEHRITSTDQVTCRKLNWWRSHGRPHGKPESNAVRRRSALDGRGVTCTPRGPIHSRA